MWRDAHSKPAENKAQQPKFHTKKKQRSNKAAQADADADRAAAGEDLLANSHMENVADQPADFVSAQQRAIFAVCNSYMDLFLPNHPYPVR